MKVTSSSMARRTACLARSRSGGAPQMPGPVIRIAPNPSRFTVRSPPTSILPAAAAVGLALMTAPSLASLRSPPGGLATSSMRLVLANARSAAPQLPAFLGDQAAPHSVRADAGRVAERKLQAVCPHRARGADRDGPGGLF